MPKQIFYIPGEKYGPGNLLLIKRSDRKDKYGKHKWGWYKCPDCGKLFEALNKNVKDGDVYRCAECRPLWRKKNSVIGELNKKYVPGMKIGPNSILFIEEAGHVDSIRLGRFKCPKCGSEEWITRLPDVCSGKSSKCQACYKKENIYRCKLNGKESAYDLSGYRFGKLTVQYLIEQDKVDEQGRLWYCICDCGGNRKAHSRDLITGKIWHCGCSTPISKGEEKIFEILSSLDIKYKREYSFIDCINPSTHKLFRFDFYLPDYNCCIEYDGIQHFKETTWERCSLQEQRQKDIYKNNYCIGNGIGLIRIPYWNYNKLNTLFLASLIESHRGGEVDELQSLSESN